MSAPDQRPLPSTCLARRGVAIPGRSLTEILGQNSDPRTCASHRQRILLHGVIELVRGVVKAGHQAVGRALETPDFAHAIEGVADGVGNRASRLPQRNIIGFGQAMLATSG